MATASFILTPVPPFRLDDTAWALRRRPQNQIDRWDGSQYTRVLAIHDRAVKTCVVQTGGDANPQLHITLHSKEALAAIQQAEIAVLVATMLGVTIDLAAFYELANGDAVLSALVPRFMGLKPPRFPTIFEALLNAFACQQVTLEVGIILLNRFTEAYGLPYHDGQTIAHAFPRPADVADTSLDAIRKLGFSFQKARAISELANGLMQHPDMLAPLAALPNDEAIQQLLVLRGVGRWTAEYVLLRGLGRIAMFPGDDVGAQRNLQRLFHLDEKPTYDTIKKLTASWQPYAGLVYFHLLLDKLQQKGCLSASSVASIDAKV